MFDHFEDPIAAEERVAIMVHDGGCTEQEAMEYVEANYDKRPVG